MGVQVVKIVSFVAQAYQHVRSRPDINIEY